ICSSHTPLIIQPTTSKPQKKKKPRKPRRHDTELPQTSVHIETVTDEAVMRRCEEDASKQGRNIADIDADAKITLVDEIAEDHGRFDDQEMFDKSVLDDEEEVLLKGAQDVQNVIEKVIEDITTAKLKKHLERATTTATSLDTEQDMGNISKTQSKAIPNEPSSPGTSSGGGPRRQDTIGDTIA
nr:hypothetical protein [Tanacetum cinerariifolium]